MQAIIKNALQQIQQEHQPVKVFVAPTMKFLSGAWLFKQSHMITLVEVLVETLYLVINQNVILFQVTI